MNTCKFCERTFKSEQTLAKHMCTKKQRMADKDTIGAQLGYRVFQRFYELSTTGKKPKSFMDFIESQYYIAFVKFGRHLVALNPIDSNDFVDYVIKNAIKLSDWQKDKVYSDYLRIHMEKEPVDRAVERSIIEMGEWSKNSNMPLSDFFTHINTIEAVFLIKSGRISPWVLYLSDSSSKLLADFTEEQLALVKEVIDPRAWQHTFISNPNDVTFVKHILREAGL